MMTKILEKAIIAVRKLSAEDQDAVGAVILSLTEGELLRLSDLDDETRAAVREGLEEARRGEFASDTEIEALWQRLGL